METEKILQNCNDLKWKEVQTILQAGFKLYTSPVNNNIPLLKLTLLLNGGQQFLCFLYKQNKQYAETQHFINMYEHCD